MPTSETMYLPKPIVYTDFELICRDFARYELKDDSFDYEMVGSSGDSQNGIDIISGKNKRGNYICIQCKDFYKGNYSGKKFCEIIEKDIEMACEKYPGSIEEFIVMTALDRKAKYQDAVRKRDWKNLVPKVYYWEDISKVIKENSDLLKKHYPQIYYIGYSESYIKTENYFYNPDNNSIEKNSITVKPRHIMFSYNENNQVIIAAEVFICNGLEKSINIYEFEYLALGTDEELICDGKFTDTNITIECNNYTLYNASFIGNSIKTKRFIIPNRIKCFWSAKYKPVEYYTQAEERAKNN